MGGLPCIDGREDDHTEKNPVVRPVWVEETWRRLMTKCVLRMVGQYLMVVGVTEHLAGGVETFI